MGSFMLLRALQVALACAYAHALTTLSASAGDDGDCALYLNGPGRTSAYDYSLNLLKGNFNYEGQHTCITYDAINQAYLEARNRILVSQPKGDWKAEDFASVGELILDISINLARRYGLTYEEIEKGLPLIDTSRTLIRDVCPPVFSHVECRAGKYRRLDGLCNNLQHPTWGSTMAPFQRLIGPLFSDGINAPRIGHTGRDLPLSRVVSRTMHPDHGYHDHAGTVMVIAWGQFMDHDYTLTGTPLDPINRNDPEECCKRPPHLKHPYCNEIRVPDDDYFYRLWGVKCIDFVRAFPSPRPGCRLGSRVPFNTLTGVIDGNTVYGVTEKFSRKLRTGFGGLLRMNPVFKEYGLKDLLPLKLDIPDEGCTRPNKNMYCFEAGEIRVNEQLVLTVMHTLMAREHNRVAKALATVNPHWDDETLFQEARRINVAEIQHITYNEFLPILLGKDVMEKFGLVVEKEGYWNGYDPHVNPDVIDAFASAAFRFGHSLLPTAVERWSKAHKFIASKRLSNLIRRPFDLYRAGVLDEYVMGLMNQVAQAMDDSITQEVTNHLFKKVGARFGMDLVSFNMQRGREFGIPGYMEFRKFCGLSGANSFQELFGAMPNETVVKYETIFEHPIDVDLWSGGVSERPLPGSMLGPTFACVIATQFSYSRRGDRFWYELPNQPSSFTPEQLQEIRKARLARVICDNTDIIDTVQLYPMVLPDHELNPRVPCRSGIIPSMDFSKWAEPTPFHGAKPFVTDAYVTPKNTSVENTFAAKEQQTNDTKNDTETENVTTIENKTLEDDSLKIQDIDKENYSPDTVLKYVYKKEIEKNSSQKSNGHKLNSLRKKRSPVITALPVIVNYETNHGNHAGGTPAGVPISRQTGKIIDGKDLADFSIKTLHEDNAHLDKNKELSDLNLKQSQRRQGLGSNEKEGHIIVHEDDLPSIPHNDSAEKREVSDGNKSDSREDSREDQNSESKEDSQEYNRSREINDSKESYKKLNEENQSNNDDRSTSNESFHIDSNEKKYQDNENSNERNHYKELDPRGSHEKYTDSGKLNDSSENKDKIVFDNGFSKRSQGSDESHERPRYEKNTHPDSKEENDYREQSGEVTYQNERNNKNKNKLPYVASEDKSYESTSNEKDDYKEASYEKDENPNIQKHSNAASDEEEAVIAILKKKKKGSQSTPRGDHVPNDDTYDNKSSQIKLRDVDLADFSYETIHDNDKGIVQSDKDHNAHLNTPLTTALPQEEKKNVKFEKTIDGTNSPYSAEISSSGEEIRKSVHIDDVEVKPVVEITNDKDGSVEDNSKEALKAKPTDDTSLETLLGVKLSSSEEPNEKLVEKEENNESGDVKQQFERIPLNYNHAKKEQEQTDEKTTESSPNTNNEEPNNFNAHPEITFHDKDPVHYDDHLNIKFDDISIKLPEIKLPEDIFAFPHEDEDEHEDEPKNAKNTKANEEKPKDGKFFHYDEHEYSGDQDNDHAKHEDHEPTYYNKYYGKDIKKEPYRSKKRKDDSSEEKPDQGDDDEEEDLYEKFVRERFGKKGTFEQRSARLSQPRLSEENVELFNALHKVLLKAQNIEKEAKKSGDPNAAYAWTVEYGRKL